MNTFHPTEAGISRFWVAFPEMPPSQKFNNLRILYPNALNQDRFTRIITANQRRTVSYLYPKKPPIISLPDVPKDFLITEGGQFWIASNPERDENGQYHFPFLDLNRLRLDPIFDDFHHLYLAKRHDEQAHIQLTTLDHGSSPIHCTIWHFQPNDHLIFRGLIDRIV